MQKVKISVDEIWPVYSIDKVDASAKNDQFEIEIPDEIYKEYVWTMCRYNLLQEHLKRYYDEATRRDSEESPRCFSEGSICEQHSFNKIGSAS